MTAIVNFNHNIPESDPKELVMYEVSEASNPDYYQFGIFDCNPITQKYIAACRLGNSHVGPGDYGKIYCWRSSNSYTWTSKQLVLEVSLYDMRNNAGGYNANGRFILFTGKYNPSLEDPWIGEVIQYSDDDGVTWSEANQYNTFTPGDYRFCFGRIQRLSNDDLIIGAYGKIGTDYHLGYLKSTDDGDTWSWTSVSNTSTTLTYVEPSIQNLGSDYLVMICRKSNMPNNTCYHQWLSTNGGTSWTDQGDTTFDTWPSQDGTTCRSRPPSLGLINYMGQNILACYYCVSDYEDETWKYEFRVVYALVSDIISSGVSAWNANTITVITPNLYSYQTATYTRDGYQHVVHKPGYWDGRGVVYFEVEANKSNLEIFSTPGSNRQAVFTALGI